MVYWEYMRVWEIAGFRLAVISDYLLCLAVDRAPGGCRHIPDLVMEKFLRSSQDLVTGSHAGTETGKHTAWGVLRKTLGARQGLCTCRRGKALKVEVATKSQGGSGFLRGICAPRLGSHNSLASKGYSKELGRSKREQNPPHCNRLHSLCLMSVAC